jgi:hypothetical protein
MVKNTGGNKSKKVARKNVSYTSGTQDVRRATDPSEMYAAVIKIYSAQRCSVLGADGNTYQCNVRGKFLKNKRGMGDGLAPGVWILIGFYEWEVRSDGTKNCDLLEIYTAVEKDKLRQLEARHLAVLMKTDGGADLTFSNFHVSGNDSKGEEKGECEDAVNDDDINYISSSDDDEPVKKPAPKPPAEKLPSLANLMRVTKKEAVSEQMDWLNISEKDI